VAFLIMTRVLQGAGAALLTPGSLAILEASFRPADRARAIGAWSGLGGVAVAAGPLVGGYLISVASWRWIFFINVPIAALVVVLGARHVPESRDPSATTPSPPDSGPPCSSRARCAAQGACSPRSRSPTPRPSIAQPVRPCRNSACIAASTRRR
jgi:MFS family permease